MIRGIDLLLAEEVGDTIGRRLANIMTGKVELSVIARPAPPPQLKDLMGYKRLTIDKTTKITVKGSGEVRELSIIASNNSFSVALTKDDVPILDKPYPELATLSPFYEFLSVAGLGEKYLFAINNIKFNRKLVIEIKPTAQFDAELLYSIRHLEDKEVEVEVS